jgi:hypothetical protein
MSMNQEQHGFVEQGTALESMRASDFDCYSAYGEVVDNSIQAFATDIRIEFEQTKDRHNSQTKKIGRILFADNGTGMNPELLHKCLKLGHSSRFNDRSGIGRFGVGMTLGAIHECRRVEVYSKTAGSEWHFTYLDLDEIRNGELVYLPAPIVKSPSHKITEFIDESGTLVIWSKYDKQREKFEMILAESEFWMGRTFRKFIWGEAKDYEKVSIQINGKTVKAFDPLFVNKRFTGFEGENSAELLPPQKISWKIPEDDLDTKKLTSDIIINISLLPESYRRDSGMGGDNYAKERRIDENEGISILRNDREVFFGILPYAPKLGSSEADQMLNRFIGCEISFSAELDSDFEVKNIKRGAKPVGELKEKLIESIAPTFRTLRELIRDRWNERRREAETDVSNSNEAMGVSSTHSLSNEFLRRTKAELLKGNKANIEENNEKIAKKINPKVTKEKINEIILGLKENGITIDEKEFIGDTFIDIEHGNQLKTLFYNTNSTFYKSYEEILNELKSKNASLAEQYKVLIDLIFVGYMLAESNIDPNEKMDGASFANELKAYWALNMSKILKKWKN